MRQLSQLSGTDKHRPFASSQKTESIADDLLDDWQEPTASLTQLSGTGEGQEVFRFRVEIGVETN